MLPSNIAFMLHKLFPSIVVGSTLLIACGGLEEDDNKQAPGPNAPGPNAPGPNTPGPNTPAGDGGMSDASVDAARMCEPGWATTKGKMCTFENGLSCCTENGVKTCCIPGDGGVGHNK
jgi:hypothetical protein